MLERGYNFFAASSTAFSSGPRPSLLGLIVIPTMCQTALYDILSNATYTSWLSRQRLWISRVKGTTSAAMFWVMRVAREIHRSRRCSTSPGCRCEVCTRRANPVLGYGLQSLNPWIRAKNVGSIRG